MNSRMSWFKGARRSAFSLIELLVVSAIISILTGLIFVAIGRVQLTAKRAKAKTEVKQLEKAFIAYHDEYGDWPIGMTSYDSDPSEDFTGIELEEKCALMLGGLPTEGAGEMQNDQGIAFIQTPKIGTSKDGKSGYLDPWGLCYKYMMDFNDDGILTIRFTNGGSTNSPKGYSVAVWSQGPDGSDSLERDNITSWKLQ